MINKILVTGASGKTGKAVIHAIAETGLFVTAFTHKAIYDPELREAGAKQVLIGDLRSENDLIKALTGHDGVYHICPNMTPDEYEIGKKVIHLCENLMIRRFVYHSVLHPQIKEMPHHWQKLLVEEELFKSTLSFTVLQPTAYLQNIMGYRKSILQGIYPMPYNVSARISMVDLRDVGAIAARAFIDPNMVHGIYELVGTDPLSQIEVAARISKILNISVNASEIDKGIWYEDAIKKNIPEYTRETLMAMFRYYDHYGLTGSTTTLSSLLGREPITIEQFLFDEFIQIYS